VSNDNKIQNVCLLYSTSIFFKTVYLDNYHNHHNYLEQLFSCLTLKAKSSIKAKVSACHDCLHTFTVTSAPLQTSPVDQFSAGLRCLWDVQNGHHSPLTLCHNKSDEDGNTRFVIKAWPKYEQLGMQLS